MIPSFSRNKTARVSSNRNAFNRSRKRKSNTIHSPVTAYWKVLCPWTTPHRYPQLTILLDEEQAVVTSETAATSSATAATSKPRYEGQALTADETISPRKGHAMFGSSSGINVARASKPASRTSGQRVVLRRPASRKRIVRELAGTPQRSLKVVGWLLVVLRFGRLRNLCEGVKNFLGVPGNAHRSIL